MNNEEWININKDYKYCNNCIVHSLTQAVILTLAYETLVSPNKLYVQIVRKCSNSLYLCTETANIQSKL